MEFLTPEEHASLSAKLAELKKVRPEIAKRIEEARALGDLKENGDYHAAREDQAMNEAEVRRLEERLAGAKVVEKQEGMETIVFIGSTVRLKDLDRGDDDLYKLVGEPSGKVTLEYVEVSVNSPMGEALMKSRVGDTVRVDAPRGVKRFEVVEILA
ncbi:MAG: transcription elongation factor GreA [Phycisphaeraceae bacterium]|nr:transcription elongation factor GreA [Phycisphaeraceae bacterium]